jgi:hypothetical protein
MGAGSTRVGGGVGVGGGGWGMTTSAEGVGTDGLTTPSSPMQGT